MSYFFEIGERTVWSPALRIGKAYLGYVRSLEEVYECSAGFSAISEDMVEIEPNAFLEFVQRLALAFSPGRQPVADLQLRAVMLPAVVMLERAGMVIEFPAVSELLDEARLLGGFMPD